MRKRSQIRSQSPTPPCYRCRRARFYDGTRLRGAHLLPYPLERFQENNPKTVNPIAIRYISDTGCQYPVFWCILPENPHQALAAYRALLDSVQTVPGGDATGLFGIEDPVKGWRIRPVLAEVPSATAEATTTEEKEDSEGAGDDDDSSPGVDTASPLVLNCTRRDAKW